MKNMPFFLLHLSYVIFIILESLPSGVGAECGQTRRGRSDAFIFHSTCQCNTGTTKMLWPKLCAYVYSICLPMFHLLATSMIMATWTYVGSSMYYGYTRYLLSLVLYGHSIVGNSTC